MKIENLKINGMTLKEFADALLQCKKFSDGLLDLIISNEVEGEDAVSVVATMCIPALLFSSSHDALTRVVKDRYLSDKGSRPEPKGIAIRPSNKQS